MTDTARKPAPRGILAIERDGNTVWRGVVQAGQHWNWRLRTIDGRDVIAEGDFGQLIADALKDEIDPPTLPAPDEPVIDFITKIRLETIAKKRGGGLNIAMQQAVDAAFFRLQDEEKQPPPEPPAPAPPKPHFNSTYEIDPVSDSRLSALAMACGGQSRRETLLALIDEAFVKLPPPAKLKKCKHCGGLIEQNGGGKTWYHSANGRSMCRIEREAEPEPTPDADFVYRKCKRCGKTIRLQVNSMYPKWLHDDDERFCDDDSLSMAAPVC